MEKLKEDVVRSPLLTRRVGDWALARFQRVLFNWHNARFFDLHAALAALLSCVQRDGSTGSILMAYT